jgi:hypothetical protein
MKTVNRGWLLRKAKAGKLVAVTFRPQPYGPYLGMEFPVTIMSDCSDAKVGHVNLWERNFQHKNGKAYQNDKGTITMMSDPVTRYDFKVIE